MNTTTETITPAKATKYLATQKRNREVQDRHVQYLAQRLLNNEWLTNGQGIIFDKQGSLIDGQHRLYAIIKTGISAKILVVRGADDNSQITIDENRNRKIKDYLQMDNIKYSAPIGTALAYFNFFQQGKLKNRSPKASNKMLQDIFIERPQIADSVMRFKYATILPKGMLGFFHYVFSLRNKQLADDFMDGLAFGENIKKADPAYMARERLLKNKTSRLKMHTNDKFLLVIKAWNLARKGLKVKALRYEDTEKGYLIK